MSRSRQILNLTVASLLLVTCSLPAIAQTRNDSRAPDATALQVLPGADRPGSDPLQLLQLEEVQKELGLTPEQVAKLKQIDQQAHSQLNQRSRGLGQQAQNPAQQRQALEKNADATRQKVAEVLKPDQLDRFRGIVLQVNGWTPELPSSRTRGTAPRDPLNLTPEQQKKVSSVQTQSQQQMSGKLQTTRTRGSNAADVCQQMEQLRTQRNEQALATLSNEQRATLEKMKGPEIALPARSCTP